MNYSFIPQKVIKKEPVYSFDTPCSKCNSNNSFPVMNMPGSSRQCLTCNNIFKPKIIGYQEYVVEKDIN